MITDNSATARTRYNTETNEQKTDETQREGAARLLPIRFLKIHQRQAGNEEKQVHQKHVEET